MKSLIPWKRKITPAGNGGALASMDTQLPLGQMRQEFGRVFDRYFGDLAKLWPSAEFDQSWGMELEDKEDAYFVHIEAPGFDSKDFDLKLQGNQLVLKGEHKVETKTGNAQEEREASLYRSVTLPDGILADKCEAKYHNGLLTVTIPKSEAGKGRHIAVKAG